MAHLRNTLQLKTKVRDTTCMKVVLLTILQVLADQKFISLIRMLASIPLCHYFLLVDASYECIMRASL